jgi:hypothetical protein
VSKQSVDTRLRFKVSGFRVEEGVIPSLGVDLGPKVEI